jgi:hypothetical protein
VFVLPDRRVQVKELLLCNFLKGNVRYGIKSKAVPLPPCRLQGDEKLQLLLVLDLNIR